MPASPLQPVCSLPEGKELRKAAAFLPGLLLDVYLAGRAGRGEECQDAQHRASDHHASRRRVGRAGWGWRQGRGPRGRDAGRGERREAEGTCELALRKVGFQRGLGGPEWGKDRVPQASRDVRGLWRAELGTGFARVGVGRSLPPPVGMAPLFPWAAGLAPRVLLAHTAPWLLALLSAAPRLPGPGAPGGDKRRHPSEDKPRLLAPGWLGQGSATITGTGTGGSRSF